MYFKKIKALCISEAGIGAAHGIISTDCANFHFMELEIKYTSVLCNFAFVSIAEDS